jgi:hypothetical protein
MQAMRSNCRKSWYWCRFKSTTILLRFVDLPIKFGTFCPDSLLLVLLSLGFSMLRGFGSPAAQAAL